MPETKIKISDKYFPGIYDKYENVCPDIERIHNYKHI